jgi:hypothetical protein
MYPELLILEIFSPLTPEADLQPYQGGCCSFMRITPKTVIPACFKQESISFRHGFPIKTFGNDRLQHTPMGEEKGGLIKLPIITIILTQGIMNIITFFKLHFYESSILC